jgi:hypothetical protein
VAFVWIENATLRAVEERDPCQVNVGAQADQPGRPLNVAADSDDGEELDLDAIDLAGDGYRWIRLRSNP